MSHQGKVETPVSARPSAVAEAPDSTALRLLEVLEGVCRLGPVTLADLVALLEIPRGAGFLGLQVVGGTLEMPFACRPCGSAVTRWTLSLNACSAAVRALFASNW